MMKYELNNLLKQRLEDKALFNFETAELIKFNESGFSLLQQALEENLDIETLDHDEKSFIKSLLEHKILVTK